MRKLRFFPLLMAMLMMLQAALPLAHAQNAVSVNVKDTVAGYPAKLQTSIVDLAKATAGVFFVTQPSGAVVRVNAKPNSIYSTLSGDLYGQQTRQAGLYKASVLLPGGLSSGQVSFRVYPGQASLTQSKITALHSLLEANEVGNIQVELLDEHLNKVPNNAVQLFSSRANDVIKPIQQGRVGKAGEPANTDEKGRAYFEISSAHPGVSTFTALHLGKALDKRVDMVFSQPTPKFKDGIGGNFLSSSFRANLLEGSAQQEQQVIAGPVHSFEIEAPASVTAGTDQSITITAKDANGITARNYTGKILIGVLGDDNASFPGEYQFTEANQGKHAFPLGFRFSTAGDITLQAFDSNNFQIGGEKRINVLPVGGLSPTGQPSTGSDPNTNTNTGSGSALSIKSPANGTIIGSSSLTLTGMAETFKNMELYVDGIKNQSFSSDGQGFFTATVNQLSEGDHELYVKVESSGGGGITSAPITVTVDTQPPVLQGIVLSPDLQTYQAGQAITAVVVSEPQLDSASLTVQGIAYPLTPGVDPGSYTTTFAAPQAGEYAIKITLIDALFNKSEYDAARFVVQEVKTALPLPRVEGMQGQRGDGSMTVVWNAVKSADTPIQSYVVRYGLAFDHLTESMEISDQTQATVSGLKNGVNYYVNVTAKDVKGVEGQPSVTLAIKPEATPEPEPLPQIMDPEVMDALLPAASFPTQPSLTAVAAESGVILQWELGSTPQSSDLAGYMAYFGLQPGQYTDSYYAQGNVKSVLVPDLIPGMRYYFKVIPVNIMGQEGNSIFPEVSAVPSANGSLLGANLLPASSGAPSSPSFLNNTNLAAVDKNAETGPEALWIVILSLLGSPLFCFYRKRVS